VCFRRPHRSSASEQAPYKRLIGLVGVTGFERETPTSRSARGSHANNFARRAGCYFLLTVSAVTENCMPRECDP
jgi:hypothetical protein